MRSRREIFYCLLFLAIGAIRGDPSVAENSLAPAAADDLFNTLKLVKMRLTTNTYLVRDGQEQLAENEALSIWMDRTGNRLKVLRKTHSVGQDGKRSPAVEAEEIIRPDAYLMVSSEEMRGKFGLQTVTTKDAVKAEDGQMQIQGSVYGPMFGFIPKDFKGGDLSVLLASPDSKTSVQESGGRKYSVQQAQSDDVRVSVWRDPARGGAIWKIDADIEGSSDPRRFDLFSYQVEDWQTVNGISLPKIFVIQNRRPAGTLEPETGSLVMQGRKAASIPEKKLIKRVKLEAIESPAVLPESDFSLSTSIPDGFRVFNTDRPTLGFIWKDGDVAPDVKQDVVVVGAGLRFANEETPSNWRMWLIGGNVLLVLALAYIVLKSRRG